MVDFGLRFKSTDAPRPSHRRGTMTTSGRRRWHRFQFSLRSLLFMFVPVALLAGLANWLLCPPAIDVAIKVERFRSYKDAEGNGIGLAADVSLVNKSNNALWYMENPRWCLLQLVDGKWLASSRGTDPPATSGTAGRDWWSVQNGLQTATILVGPVSEKATAIKIVVPFTTDRFMPRRHWVSSPEVRIVKRGKDYLPEVERGASCTESLTAPL